MGLHLVSKIINALTGVTILQVGNTGWGIIVQSGTAVCSSYGVDAWQHCWKGQWQGNYTQAPEYVMVVLGEALQSLQYFLYP